MNHERKKVLEMLSQQKISAEDAEQLLEKIGQTQGTSAESQQDVPLGTAPKFMCVRVDSVGGDVVDVRLPIGLLRTGIKLSAMLPKEASEAMSKTGFDFAQLGSLPTAELVNALKEMSVDVCASGGERVRITCE
jgi:hypothetical protein